MFLIRGPWPAMKTTLLLPSPEMSNNRGNQNTVQTLRAMDGTLYTYKKSKRSRGIFFWEFVVSKDKALETKEFFREYGRGLVQATDHRDVSRTGWIVLNPIDMGGEGRAGGWGEIEEANRFAIEFEEKV